MVHLHACFKFRSGVVNVSHLRPSFRLLPLSGHAGKKELLSQLLQLMPKLVWIYHCFAGVDMVIFPELIAAADRISLTNARGLFSSSLAEYVLFACLHFAKDADRWKRQQREHKWERFCVAEVIICDAA